MKQKVSLCFSLSLSLSLSLSTLTYLDQGRDPAHNTSPHWHSERGSQTSLETVP